MDNYIPADESVEEAENPFPDPFRDCKTMNVGKNAKFRHIIQHVDRFFEDDSNRFVIFKSIDGATDKAISCVEVFKSQAKIELYQWTKITYSKRVVLWKCLMEGPRDIRATIEVPVIFIVVSKDPFPGEFSCMSMQCSSDREIAFRPLNSSRPKKPTPKKVGNRKVGDGNKWSKPSGEQRKKEMKERSELLKEVENSSIGE
ncbi:unnamed protein product [Caenorhabditis angaria]|uniref:DNA/RNA-binding protein Alba-like domain-containing protein n=1 Tax=Caenorhabditis angaria TaxID=860376 RepID=A0A9P1IJJ8_9PELO|nr:unnamed protein product [Caenorhabditis angaria]